MKITRTISLVIILLISGCDTFEIDIPDTSNRAVFERIWQLTDRHYAGFTATTVDWNGVYQVYAPQVTDNMDEQSFFDVMASMLDTLRDTHIHLDKGNQLAVFSPEMMSQFDLNVLNGYLRQRNNQAMYTYGKVSGQIGYFHIETFEGHYNGYEHIDQVLEAFRDCTGIIIDVRRNAGGDEDWARYIAGKFYKQDHAYSLYKVRNGPEHDDFSEAVQQVCQRAVNARTDVNLVLLIDNTVGSAGEDFTMMLKQVPGITLIGTLTGGRPGGIPTLVELPNGWTVQIPIGAQFTLEGAPLLHVGIAPDIHVTEIIPGRDMLLERAIYCLNQ